MKFVEIIKMNEPEKTEQYLALSMRSSADIREAKEAGVFDILLAQCEAFKAKGIKKMVLESI